MRYDFECPKDGYFQVTRPMADSSRPIECPTCESRQVKRLWSMPMLMFPETSAVEVLNRHVRGEGDPLPGYTQAQTMWMANEKARIQKREKGQKSSSGSSQSFPGGGAVSRVHGD